MRLTTVERALVEERADGFVGREWVLDRIRAFLDGAPGMLLVRAGPGVGKTALAARLAKDAAGSTHSGIDAAFFCQAGRADLLDIARRLSEQLAETVPGFSDEFAVAMRSTSTVVVQDTSVTTGDVSDGAIVAAVRIDLERLGPERAFANGVTLPLQRLADRALIPTSRPIVILIDGLDEAFASNLARPLPKLLSQLVGVHVVCTSRDDPRVLSQLGDGYTSLHLVDDEPADVHDLEDWLRSKLGVGKDSGVVRRIANAAAGNFLYATYAVDALGHESVDSFDLPAGLPGVYRRFLQREVAADEDAWTRRFRPLLGPLTVAGGEGLDTATAAAIASHLTGEEVPQSRVRDVARAAGQFLLGDQPDGPFRLYHQSFADFLTDATSNPDWVVDSLEMHRAIATALIARARAAAWSRETTSEYVRTNLARHAAAAGGGLLDELVSDRGFLVATSPSALLSVAAAVTDPESRRALAAYQRASHHLAADATDVVDQARAYLRLAGLQVGSEIAAGDPHRTDEPWWPAWAWWRPSPTNRVLIELPAEAAASAIVHLDGVPHLVAGGHFGLCLVDLDSARIVTTARGLDVRSLAVVRDGLQAFVVAAHRDASLTAFDLPALRRIRHTSTSATTAGAGEHPALVVAPIEAPPSVVVGDDYGSLSLWTVPDLQLVAERRDAHAGIYDIATRSVAGRPVVIAAGDTLSRSGTASDLPAVALWSVPNLERLAALVDDRALVESFGTMTIDGGVLVMAYVGGRSKEARLITSDGAVERWTPVEGFESRVLDLGAEFGTAIASSASTISRLRVRGTRVTATPCPVGAASYSAWRGPVQLNGEPCVLTVDTLVRAWPLNDLFAAFDAVEASGEPGGVHAVGRLAATRGVIAGLASDDSVRLWTAEGRTVGSATLADSSRVIGFAAVSVRGRDHIVVVRLDGSVRVLDAESLAWSDSFATGGRVSAVAVGRGPASATLAAAVDLGWGGGQHAHAVRLWDLATGVEIDTGAHGVLREAAFPALRWQLTLERPDRSPDAVTMFDDNDRRLLAAASARGFGAWDLSTLTSLHAEARREGVVSLAGGPGLVAIADVRGDVEVLDTTDWRSRWSALGHGVDRVTVVVRDGVPALLAGTHDGWLRMWSDAGASIEAIEIGERIFAIQPVGGGLVAVGTGRGLIVLDVPGTEPL